MLLQALYELYARLNADPAYGLPALGRSSQKVTFVVVLEPDGGAELQDHRIQKDGKFIPRSVEVLGMTKPSGSALNPCFLWDTAGYLLGWDPRPERGERAKRTFEEFRKRHLEVASSIGSPAFDTVCRFLQRWTPERAQEHLDVLQRAGGGYGVFQLRGCTAYVHDDPKIQAWWDAHTQGDPERMKLWWAASNTSATSRATGQCLITGKTGPIARLHEPRIKGVAGAKTTGGTLVGYNQPAYCSYGLEQSYNAPVSVTAARRYALALNALLDGPRRERHRVVLGQTTVVFWTAVPTRVEDVFAAFCNHGSALPPSVQDEGLRQSLGLFFRALRDGRKYLDEPADTSQTDFFILGLAAPTPARIAVRFFYRTTLGGLLANLRRHYEDIRVEYPLRNSAQREQLEFPSVRHLLGELGGSSDSDRQKGHLPGHLPPAVLEAIVAGGRYPQALYELVLRRIRAGSTGPRPGSLLADYFKVSLIKGILIRNFGKEVSVSLDKTRSDPAYRLGRLFAVLEKTQKDALGSEINATIRDRFYSSASATPAAVFPRLLRGYQHHLGKLDPGKKVFLEKLVQEILDPVPELPAHLDLPGQGLFALGYYHQLNELFRRREAEESDGDSAGQSAPAS